MGYIYCITSPSGKQYVGQTSRTVDQRWKQHCEPNNDKCRGIHRAISKYGKENMVVETIEECDDSTLNEREAYWISTLGTIAPDGYNLLTGGEHSRHTEESKRKLSEQAKKRLSDKRNHPMYGKHQSEETKDKLRSANVGKKVSPEVAAKISSTLKGRKKGPMSDETKKKLSHAMSGRVASDETRRKLSEALSGRSRSPESIAKAAESNRGKKRSAEACKVNGEVHSKAVRCVETGEVFPSAREATRSFGGSSQSAITNNIKGRSKTCYGYHWEYAS